MGNVSDILSHKGSAVHAIEPDASVQDAVVMMVEANVGSLLVMTGGEVVGILTERDYLRRVALSERPQRTIAVSEVMTSPVVTVTSDTGIEQCLELMTERRFRHLAVVDDGALTGVVSIGDLVKARSAEQSTHLHVLHEYITAR
jgi:CBS domain-containing protein